MGSSGKKAFLELTKMWSFSKWKRQLTRTKKSRALPRRRLYSPRYRFNFFESSFGEETVKFGSKCRATSNRSAVRTAATWTVPSTLFIAHCREGCMMLP